jgi:tRNA-dihydrouridine synthase B
MVIGTLKLESPIFLAPMAGYTDLPFRLIVRSFGGLGLAFTEMLNPASILRGREKKVRRLLATNLEDQPLGYQIYGVDPAQLAEAARWLVDRGAPLIDVNMGCPQKKISGRGAGAGLLRKPDVAVEMIRRVLHAVQTPVTVKIRLGWDHARTAVDLAREFEQLGVSAITVHGRTRMQRFMGQSDWEAIAEVRRAVDQTPVIANGDIVSVESAREVFRITGCAGIMLGRQPIKEPWIIRDIARDLNGLPPLPPPNREEHLALLLRHFEQCVESDGEKLATLQFRKWAPQYLKTKSIPRSLLASLQKIQDAMELKTRLSEAMMGVFSDEPAAR